MTDTKLNNVACGGPVTQPRVNEQALFEAWAVSDDGGWLASALARNPEGHEFDYRDDNVQAEWRAWQGRAAITQQAAPEAPSANAEAIQWRNIQKVVMELAKFCFGDGAQCGQITLGAAHTALVNSLAAKDGLDVRLEPLRASPVAAPEAPASEQADELSNAEFLSKRLARVAKLAGVTMPSGTHEQIAEVAGTILGDIAYRLERASPAATTASTQDDIAVDAFAAAMKERMAEKRSQGKKGWANPARCSISHLMKLMKGTPGSKPVDIGNYAMMLFNRAEWENNGYPPSTTQKNGISTQSSGIFDAWLQNPYTKALQKSIAEDYIPKSGTRIGPATTASVSGEGWDRYIETVRDLTPEQRLAQAPSREAPLEATAQNAELVLRRLEQLHQDSIPGGWRELIEEAMPCALAVWRAALAQQSAERAAAEDALVALLPGPYYMDLPDGGDVPVLEQVRRMAVDAERYRWLRGSATDIGNVIDKEFAPGMWEYRAGEELDCAIDAARIAHPGDAPAGEKGQVK